MKKLSAWILAVVMSVTFAVGCGGQKAIGKDSSTETESAASTGMTDDELKQIIKISGYAITIPNSAGAISAYIDFKNTNPSKEIKYAYFNFTVLNRVNDPIKDKITDKDSFTLKYTGPLASGKSNLKDQRGWADAFYNEQATSVRLESATIQYMDETSVSLNAEEIYRVMANDLFGNPDKIKDAEGEAKSITVNGKTEVPQYKLLVGRDIKPGIYKATGSTIINSSIATLSVPANFSVIAFEEVDEEGYSATESTVLLIEDIKTYFKSNTPNYIEPCSSAVFSFNTSEWIGRSLNGNEKEDDPTHCYVEPIKELK